MNTNLSLRLVVDTNAEEVLGEVVKLLLRRWTPTEFEAAIDHSDPRFQFDMLLMGCQCCTCNTAMVRGELVRCKPVADSKYHVTRMQCAACAKAEVLPMFDAEVKP